ncbi:hypothetical protein QN277_002951 [Acacia crassicarpa]|uniref:Retrotransposon Copia-like N-terminal domain-containing protein n=1 Tax=Acacia crassicarpa TaxID=499986 RepID=A0AAE1NBZ1_9FABA|nr:hypothetical protein QN277_002951 [Acacia crassicarpa]
METTKTPVDVNHPLYLHPSNTHITSLVPQVLTGSANYVVWSRAMRLALRGKNKIGFIDGTFPRTRASEYADLWDRCDAVVLSWLIQLVDKEIATGIVFADSSHLVWQDL